MPKLSNIPAEDVINVLKEYVSEIPNFITQPSSEFWKLISRRLDGKISSKGIYTFVKCNRHQCQNILGLNISNLEKNLNHSDSEELSSDGQFIYKTFHLKSEEWNLIKPEEHQGIRPRLRLKVGWTDIVAAHLTQIFNNNCIWVFKNHHIHPNGKHYLTFTCYCKECHAFINGFNLSGVNTDNTFTVSCTITQGNFKLHSGSSIRHLAGIKRQEVGQILAYGKSACNCRRDEAFHNMHRTDSKENLIYSLPVLRKCKQEFLNKQNPSSNLTKYPILNLEILKYTQPYNTAIKQINLDKFQLLYWTAEQIEIVHHYCKTNLIPLIAIDATGTLVKKIQRPYNYESGHIFLYSAVIHTGVQDGQIPISQMLSEAHDILSIAFWLRLWIKNIQYFPKIITCDHSLALLGAISLSFNNLSLKEYLKITYSLINNKSSITPNIMIRVDYAHIIKLIGRWESLRKKPRQFREFYMRSMTLIIKSHDLSQATFLIESLLVTSLSEYCGSNNGILTPCEERKRELKQLISGCDILQINEEENSKTDTPSNYIFELESLEEDNEITTWILNMKNNSIKLSNFVSDDENYHYNPTFVNDLSNLLKTFPIWSAVTNRIFGYGRPTESSAIVESYFHDLKQRTFRQQDLPIRVDKFFMSHFQAIQGMLSLANRSLERQCLENKENERIGSNCKEEFQIIDNDTVLVEYSSKSDTRTIENEDNDIQSIKEFIDKDIHEFDINKKKDSKINVDEGLLVQNTDIKDSDKEPVENWFNLAEKPQRKRKRASYYGIPCPEILHVNEGKKIKIGLLQNGNLSQKPILLSKNEKYFMLNTCAFDAFCQSIAVSYCDSLLYKSFLDSKDDTMFISLVKLFLKCGAKLSVYKLRALILQNKKTLFKICNLKSGSVQLSCECNVTLIVSKFFDQFPSATESSSCSSNLCSTQNKNMLIDLLPINIDIINNLGYESLKKAFDEGRLRASNCQKCNDIIQYNLETEGNIFFDTNGCKECKLVNIPCTLKLDNKTYILRSVIHFVEPGISGGLGHYISYCRRIDSMWEKYDNLLKSPENVKNSLEIKPHLIMYTI